MYSRFTNQLLAQEPGFDFVAAHFECERNRFSRDNPDGFVNFGSAQNFLVAKLVEQRLKEDTSWLQAEDLQYQAFSGTATCRAAVAQHLGLLGDCQLDPGHLVIGNGLIGLMEALSIALLDKEDIALMPAPVFPGLVHAITTRTNAEISWLNQSANDGFVLTPTALEAALQQAKANDKPPRAVVLCSPGNPVGNIFQESDLKAFVEITRQFGCWLIVDEIYAASCFGETKFTSVLGQAADHVIVLGGLSKDFGIAGYATGWLHSRDAGLLQSLRKQSHFFRLPASIQRGMEHLLDPSWRSDLVVTNQMLLGQQYQRSVSFFQETQVPVSPAEAGLCLWLDLRSWLPTSDTDSVMKLYKHLLYQHRVHISPGTGFHCEVPGFFRTCFSHASETLDEGLQRIRDGLETFRKLNPTPPANEAALP